MRAERAAQKTASQSAKPLPMTGLRAMALDLLARREYSRVVLERRLLPLAESVEALARLLDDLAARQQLSDARYARSRVNVRGRRYGDSRVARELRQDGLDNDAIAAALAEGEDELSRCQGVWQRKFAALPGTLTERARQQRFLRYRGFSAEAIRQVLRGWIEEDET
ncbi:MAG: recombination regulator RecX [Zoogloeaceae bacterium]|jgi:regulatory protein|nr:recombination regulator RecX [Zoogloeaceae bacterium]